MMYLAAVEADAGESSGPVSEVRQWISVNAYADVESAYWARGKIVDRRPYSAQFADMTLKLGKFGNVGGYAWSVSSLSGGGQSAGRRNAYNEVDWCVYYAYDLKLAEEWSLSSRIARQWVTLPGYFPDAGTVLEWHVGQALSNPFVTPYYLLRRATDPVQWCYWQIGAKRTFALTDDLSLTVDFFGDCGDARHFRDQYGPKPEDPQSRYHGGLMALNLVLRLDYAITDNVGIFAFVHQFDITDADSRDTVKESHAAESKRDLTMCGVGMAVKF